MFEKKSAPAGGTTGQGALTSEADYNIQHNPEKHNIKAQLRKFIHAKGIEPDHNGFIRCPFHEEKTPSCKVNDEYIHCFGCGESGDIYKVAAALIGVSCDKENFREIATDVERTLGVPEWKPQRQYRGDRPKLSESAVYRSELLKDFAKALDSGDLDRAYFRACLLLALFMLPEAVYG